MKNILCTLILALCATFAFSQVSLTPKPKADTSLLAKLPLLQVGSDFDFEYYTPATYTRIFNGLDSTGVMKADTTGFPNVSQTKIEKKGTILTLHNLANISRPHYTVQVVFVGITDDASLVYRTGTQVAVILNPVFGWAIVVFEQPGKSPFLSAIHSFGPAPSMDKYLK